MFELRVANKEDAENLSRLATQTFLEAWHQYNTKEDMQLYIDKNFSYQPIVQDLQNKSCTFLIVSIEKNDVGYLKLREGNPPKLFIDPDAAEIEKLYVLGQFQSQGIGNALVQIAESMAIEKGYEVLWLSVWKPNLRAMSLYTRLGFELCGEQEFILGNDVQYDYIMKKTIIQN